MCLCDTVRECKRPFTMADSNGGTPIERTSSPCIPQDTFQKALETHLDESKPDPLALWQVQEWQLIWKEQQQHADILVDDSYALNGSLEIHGAHVIVTLESQCTWTSPVSGTLDFTLLARARFSSNRDHCSKRNKAEIKIRAEMTKRLQDDDYIKPLLDSRHGLALCEAHIYWIPNKDHLEERVRVDQQVAEGVRRSIYSQSSSTLALIELLTCLPYLPLDNILAQRAKLRLLEDAMVDACEEEGENDLLDELTLKQDDKEAKDNAKPKRTKRG